MMFANAEDVQADLMARTDNLGGEHIALHRAERETCGGAGSSCCETVDSNLHLRHFSRTTFISIDWRTTPLCHRGLNTLD